MNILKGILYKGATLLFLLTVSLLKTYALPADNNDKGYILVFTAYSEDEKRINAFVNDIMATLDITGLDFGLKIELLGYGPLTGANSWHKTMRTKLQNHDYNKIKAIILLGQEAWAVYLSLEDKIRPDVPFYGAYISQFGVIIPEHIDDFTTWQPLSINTKIYADTKGRAGAVMNHYDFVTNINLIKKCFPRAKNIAFLTDNTYGGVSLQASFIKTMNERYKDLNPILLDGRKNTIDEIRQKIEQLPQDAVLLLGSWLVDNSGTYFVSKEFNVLLSGRADLPVFTISGVGYKEGYAIGGFTPVYQTDPKFIINDIKRYYTGTDNGRSYKYNSNVTLCNESLLEKFNLSKNLFPEGTRFENSYDFTIQKYQNTIKATMITIIGLLVILVLILILLTKIKKQNKSLKNKSEELAKAKEAAEKSDKLKSAFLANMSHEIRTPLNAIVGFSDMLTTASDEQKNEYTTIIKNNSEVLLKLVDEIVNFSKIESGFLEFKYSKFNISEYFREMKKSLSLHKPEQLDLICEIPYYNCEIVYDKERLTQLVTNLVNNAFKFTPQGRVAMGFRVERKGIVVYVSDTGIGIAKENQERIFKRFEKVDPFVQGAGLGLAVCKAIAEGSKGSIDIQSELGCGTVFNVHIPCEVTFSKENNETIAPEIMPETTSSLSVTLKLLYAEDDESNSMLVKHILSDYQIVHVENGKKAVEAMRNDWFDLVLMDIKMPEMDGLQAAATIRQFDKSTPIIALSAYAYDSDKQKAMAAGCNDFITKPFSKNKLFAAIEKLM